MVYASTYKLRNWLYLQDFRWVDRAGSRAGRLLYPLKTDLNSLFPAFSGPVVAVEGAEFHPIAPKSRRDGGPGLFNSNSSDPASYIGWPRQDGPRPGSRHLQDR